MSKPNLNNLVLATRNKHKAHEIGSALGSSWSVATAADLCPDLTWDEIGTTFEENARIKAKALWDATHLPVLADDSGLEVQALGGAPGVYSSSYGGTEGDHAANNKKLLKELETISDRRAEFVCCLLYVDAGGKEHLFWGRCAGMMLDRPKGQHGFGYDPLFFVPSLNKSMAELTTAEKNSISHRAKALAAFVSYLKAKNE